MPFSIITKDGITINNIPDDIDPNSDVLKARVAVIRQQRAGGQDGTTRDLGPGGPGGGLDTGAVDQRGAGLDVRDQGVQQPIQSINPQAPLQGPLEAGISLISGAVAEPVAGLAGIAQAANPFAAPGAGARAVEATRQALTLQPGTPAGAGFDTSCCGGC